MRFLLKNRFLSKSNVIYKKATINTVNILMYIVFSLFYMNNISQDTSTAEHIFSKILGA